MFDLTYFSWMVYICSLPFDAPVFISGIIILILCTVWVIAEVENTTPPLVFKLITKVFVVFFIVFGIAAFLVPDRQTLLTIAAIEYGTDLEMFSRMEQLLDTYMPKEE